MEVAANSFLPLPGEMTIPNHHHRTNLGELRAVERRLKSLSRKRSRVSDPKTTRWATSSDCQCSSGLKQVWISSALTARKASAAAQILFSDHHGVPLAATDLPEEEEILSSSSFSSGRCRRLGVGRPWSLISWRKAPIVEEAQAKNV